MTTRYKYLGVRGRSDYVHAECWANYRDQNSRYDAQGRCVSGPTYDSELQTFRGIREKRCLHCDRPLLAKPPNTQPTIAKLLTVCRAADALYSNLADGANLSGGEDWAWQRLLDAIDKEQRVPLQRACRQAEALYSSLADTDGLSDDEGKDWQQLIDVLAKAER